MAGSEVPLNDTSLNVMMGTMYSLLGIKHIIPMWLFWQPEAAQGPNLLEKLVDGLVEVVLRGARLLPDPLDRDLLVFPPTLVHSPVSSLSNLVPMCKDRNFDENRDTEEILIEPEIQKQMFTWYPSYWLPQPARQGRRRAPIRSWSSSWPCSSRPGSRSSCQTYLLKTLLVQYSSFDQSHLEWFVLEK